ncbi:type IV secretion system DNA-binding domain-containing protein [Leptospirillum sp. Group II 'CF-1']|uniref:type IV secretion system DNA-binding domain-containing protein n=1 Tax=Leptospirillum sp. Group II 'CF-1' TaxID=1660083 RepID=UPI0018CEED11|nr:type IV secretion system DNA-binding domain-containing protein [Leptospirillum sp. Group II 'CF-1']
MNDSGLHTERPDPDHLGSGFFLFFWIFLFTILGLAIGVGVDFESPLTSPLLWIRDTLGIATEAFFQFSGLSFLLNLLPHVYFSNAWLGVKPWEDLSGVGSLIPYVSTGAIIGAGIGGRTAWNYHQNVTNPIRHLSGPKILAGPGGAKVLQKEIAKHFSVDGIRIHPLVRISMEQETRHMMLIGASGGGKTTFLWQLVDQLLARGDKFFLHDVKADFTQRLKNRIILAPWDRRSRRWLIGQDITNEALAQAFSECFIIPNPKASDPVWDNAARALLRCEIHKLMVHKGTNWTFRDLGKGLLDDLLVGVDDPVENMKNLQNFVRTYYPEAWQIVRDATSKATASVLFTQGGQLGSLIDICRLDSELEKKKAKGFWLDPKEKGFLSDEIPCAPVILKRSGESRTWSRSFFSAFVNVMALKIEDLGDKKPWERRIWFLLDEVPQMGKTPEITTFLETARSKGIRVALGFQNREQIDKQQGNKEDLATWDQNIGTKVWFQDAGREAKKWASESVGTHTVQIYSKTHTKGFLPPASGASDQWGEPKEKKLLEEHDFEMILRPKPKLKIVTALLQIAGFDRVVLDWPMLPRPVLDPLEKDPVVLPPRVLVDARGEVISSSLSFVEDSLSSPPSGGGGASATKEEEKKEKEPGNSAIKTEHMEIVQPEKKPVTSREKEEKEEEVEKEVGEKILTASLSGEEFTGDMAIDSLKLLAAMLDASGKSGTVGRVQIAKAAPAPEPEDKYEEER